MPHWMGRPAADVSGVGGPVACGQALPGDSDVGVDAQGAGKYGGRDLAGELEQRGAAGLAGTDAEVGQPLGEPGGADRPSGLASGEEPGRWLRRSDGGVAFAVRRDSPGQRGDRLGQLDGSAAEAEPDVEFAEADLADGHAADRGCSLCVEEDEQPGEPVFGLEVVVVQEPPRDVPAVLVIEEPRGSVPSGGRGEVAGGELAAAGPADEPAGFLAVDGSLVGEPPVK